MLSPSTTTSGSPPAKSSAMPTTSAMPPGCGLHLVGEIELEQRRVAVAHRQVAVAEQVDHLPRVALAGDDEHLADPGELQQLQRVVDHRPAADRQQVLVGDARQLPEPRRLSSCADESLHGAMLTADQAACDRLGAGSASGLRSSSQNESSTAGPIPNAKTSVPIPTVPPKREADHRHEHLDRDPSRRRSGCRPGGRRRASASRAGRLPCPPRCRSR